MHEAPLELDLCWRELAIVAKALADGRDMAARAIDKAPVTAKARGSFNPNRARRAGEQLYHSDRMEAGEPRDLPGRVPGAFESQQLQISFHSGQISLRNGSYEFGDFKRFVCD